MSSGSSSVVTPPQQPSLLGTVGRYHNLVLRSLYQLQLTELTNTIESVGAYLDRSKATRNEVLAEPVNLLLDTSFFSSYSSLPSSLLARLECATQHQNKGSLSVRVRVDLFSPLYSTPLKPCIAFVLISTVNQSYMSIPT
jgi:hypothetical protein